MKSRLKFLVLPIFLSLLIVGCKSEKIGSEATFVEFQVPTQKSEPQGIALDQEGKVWFTERAADKIGRLDPKTKEIIEFTVPTQKSEPQGIALDQEGKVWFTERAADKIGRLDPKTGEKNESPIPTAGSPDGLAIDSDGNVWFVETFAGKIGKLAGG